MRYVSVILRRYRGDIGDGFTFIDVKKLGAPYDSTGFYFNDDVEIDVVKTRQGRRWKAEGERRIQSVLQPSV